MNLTTEAEGQTYTEVEGKLKTLSGIRQSAASQTRARSIMT